MHHHSAKNKSSIWKVDLEEKEGQVIFDRPCFCFYVQKAWSLSQEMILNSILFPQSLTNVTLKKLERLYSKWKPNQDSSTPYEDVTEHFMDVFPEKNIFELHNKIYHKIDIRILLERFPSLQKKKLIFLLQIRRRGRQILLFCLVGNFFLWWGALRFQKPEENISSHG